MAINIPSVQSTPLSTNVRRLDVGVQPGQAKARAFAELSDTIGNFTNKLAEVKAREAKVKKRLDDEFWWKEEDSGVETALDAVDGEGKIKLQDGTEADAEEHVKEIHTQREAKAEKDGYDPEEVAQLKLTNLDYQNRIAKYMSGVRKKGTIDSVVKTVNQASMRVQNNPSYSNINDEIDMFDNTLNNLKGVLSDNEINEIRDRSSSQLVKSYVNGVENKEGASKALALFGEESPYTKYLTPDEVDRERNRLGNEVRIQQRAWEAEAVSNLQMMSENAKNGIEPDVNEFNKYTAGLSRSEKNKTKYKALIDNVKTNVMTSRFRNTLYNGGVKDADIDKTVALFPSEGQNKIRTELTSIVDEHKMNMAKKGADYLVTVNPKAAEMASKMSIGPEEFDAGYKYFENYMEESGVSSSISTKVPANLFKEKALIINKAVASGNAAVVVDEINELKKTTGARFDEAYNSLFDRGNVQLKRDIAVIGKIQDPVRQEEAASILLNKNLLHDYKKQMGKDANLKRFKEQVKGDSRLDFISQINNGDLKSQEDHDYMSSSIAKMAIHYKMIGMDDDDAIEEALSGFKSSYNYVQVNDVNLAVPKQFDGKKIGSVANAILDNDSEDVTLDYLAKLRNVENVSPVVKDMISEGKWLPNKDNTGLELWAINPKTGTYDLAAFRGTEPLSFTYKELQEAHGEQINASSRKKKREEVIAIMDRKYYDIPLGKRMQIDASTGKFRR